MKAIKIIGLFLMAAVVSLLVIIFIAPVKGVQAESFLIVLKINGLVIMAAALSIVIIVWRFTRKTSKRSPY